MREKREKRNKRKKNTEKSGRTATYIALPQSQGFFVFFFVYPSSLHHLSSHISHCSCISVLVLFQFKSLQLLFFFHLSIFSSFFFFFFLLMERNEHLGGLFPRWPIDKRVESRTHLEITCRPFCFVFKSRSLHDLSQHPNSGNSRPCATLVDPPHMHTQSWMYML